MGRLTPSTYYDKHYRQGPALIRARQPFLIRNIVTGVGLFAMTIGIYVWTINAVAQDDFSDLEIPDAPAQPPHSPHTGVQKAVSGAAFDKQREERLNPDLYKK